MKKVFVFVLVIALVSSSLFAITGHGGVKMGPSFSWYKVDPDDLAIDTISVEMDIDGATYFNEGRNLFGLGYGLRINLPLIQQMGGYDIGRVEMMKFGFAPNLTFQYKFRMTERFSLEAGAGFSMMFYNKEFDGMEVNVNIFSLLANLGINYKFNKLLGLRAGINVSTPVKFNAKQVSRAVVQRMEGDAKGVAIVPYLGLSVFY